MAPDQRYCLQCGSRGANLPGVREGLQASSTAHGSQPAVQGAGMEGAHVAASAAPARANNTVSVIASVGVLLLAMGVGVLIGRANSGSNAGKAAAAPQVISVAAPGASTATTPSAVTPPVGPSTKKGKASSSSSSGVGQTESKPAPASVLKNLRTGGSGQSYEQKSKNLPNVISTG
jgi:hypothetical protein